MIDNLELPRHRPLLALRPAAQNARLELNEGACSGLSSPVLYTSLESLAFLQDFRLGSTICDGQWKFLEITIAKRKCDEGIRTGTVITY
jgi:hypothetical protein